MLPLSVIHLCELCAQGCCRKQISDLFREKIYSGVNSFSSMLISQHNTIHELKHKLALRFHLWFLYKPCHRLPTELSRKKTTSSLPSETLSLSHGLKSFFTPLQRRLNIYLLWGGENSGFVVDRGAERAARVDGFFPLSIPSAQQAPGCPDLGSIPRQHSSPGHSRHNQIPRTNPSPIFTC